MQTVINKLGLFPEWSNFSESNKNLAQSEDTFVKSLDPIKCFEGSDQNMYEFPNLPILTHQIQDISTVMENGNQAISCESSDLKNLESIYNKFQTKKFDKSKFDCSYKKSIKKSDAIHEMIEQHQLDMTNLENDEEKAEPGSKQEKFDQEFDEYQHIFIQSLSNIFNEFSSTRMRTATKIAEVGSLLSEKASPIQIVYGETMNELNEEIKKLKKVVRNNDKILNNEDTVKVCDDDEFTIVEDQKGVIELSDGEYYEDEYEDDDNSAKPQSETTKVQNSAPPTDESITRLAKMLFDDEEQNNNNINNTVTDNSKAQEDVKFIASNFLVPENDDQTNVNAEKAENAANNAQPKPKTRRHRRGKKGKH